MVYSALFKNVSKAFILFLNKYAAEIQLPGNGVYPWSPYHRGSTQSSAMACHW
jgi:hypothetical protein